MLRREAEIDLDEIFVWYEEQQPGLGFLFINDFETTLQRIDRNPFHAFNIQADARSAALKKFPYEIIYRIDEVNRQVRIIGVIHQHRNPEWFRQRLKI